MLALRGNEIYCKSDLIARYSSWMEYSYDFFRTGWTKGMLCILLRLNCSDFSTKGICNTTYKVPDNMKDWSFIHLHMYQMFSPSHWGRANHGCGTSWPSSLASNSLRFEGFSNVDLSFCELITETWSKIDRMSILTEFIPLWSVTKWLLNWNIVIKIFLLWKVLLVLLIGSGLCCLPWGCPFVMTSGGVCWC